MALSQKHVSWLKGLIFILALLPFFRLVVFTILDKLGANPVEFITRNTGDWTLYFLCIALAVTPARKLLNFPWLLKLRRVLGLYGFFYATLHFLTFLWFDHFFDLQDMWKDVLKRPFITVGFIAFVPLGVLHYYWMKSGKHDLMQPLIFAAVVATLLLARLWWHWSAQSRTQASA